MDATETLGCYIELMDYYLPFRESFRLMKEICAEWDGTQPDRTYTEFFAQIAASLAETTAEG